MIVLFNFFFDTQKVFLYQKILIAQAGDGEHYYLIMPFSSKGHPAPGMEGERVGEGGGEREREKGEREGGREIEGKREGEGEREFLTSDYFISPQMFTSVTQEHTEFFFNLDVQSDQTPHHPL